MVMSGDFGDHYPITGSHEPSGTIVALGPDVDERGGVRVGQRVAGLLPLSPCGEFLCYLLLSDLIT